MSYLNRTATLLSGGSATRPVAILYHADAEWAGSAMPIERVAAELTRAQIDFDFVPAEAFEDEDRYEVSIADGMFTVNDCRYQAFVMPGSFDWLGDGAGRKAHDGGGRYGPRRRRGAEHALRRRWRG